MGGGVSAAVLWSKRAVKWESAAGAKAVALRTPGKCPGVSPTIQDAKRSGIRAQASGDVHWRCGNGAQSERQELSESRLPNEPMYRCRIWRPRLAGTRIVTGEFCGDSSASRQI